MNVSSVQRQARHLGVSEDGLAALLENGVHGEALVRLTLAKDSEAFANLGLRLDDAMLLQAMGNDALDSMRSRPTGVDKVHIFIELIGEAAARVDVRLTYQLDPACCGRLCSVVFQNYDIVLLGK